MTRRRAILIFFAALLLSPLALIRPDRSAASLRAKYAKAPSQFIEVAGLATHYRDEGPRDKPTLVLLHGTAASLFTWDGWVKELQNDFRLVRLDLPGYALTGPGKSGFDYSGENYAKFLAEFADKVGLKRFHLAGNSLGGYIAWNYAVAHPERVDRLVLVDAGGYPARKPPLIFRLARIPLLGSALVYITPRFLIRRNLLQVYGDDTLVTDAKVDLYHDMVLRDGNREALHLRLNQLAPRDPAAIKTISQPTLILWGGKDEWIAPEFAQRFKADIRNSRVIIYPEAGHIPMEEIPVKTARDARTFLLGK